MGRRYEEVQENARRELDEAKAVLKRLRYRERAFVLRWLCKYFSDDGAMFSPQLSKQRRTIVIDGIAYWLVAIPKRPN